MIAIDPRNYIPSQCPGETAREYTERLAFSYVRSRSHIIRNKLIERMYGYVWKAVAQKYKSYDDMHDIWSYIMLNGVIPATDRYRTIDGGSYIGYISSQIRYAFMEYYRTHPMQHIKIPRAVSDLLRSISVLNNQDGVTGAQLTDNQLDTLNRAEICRSPLSLPELIENGIEPTVDDPCADIPDRMHMTNTLRSIVHRMGNREYARFIELHFFDELELPEVAAKLGLSMRDTYTLKSRAIAALKVYKPVIDDALMGIDCGPS